MTYQTDSLPNAMTGVQKPDFFRDFTDGIISYGKAYQLIARHKLWYYMVVPGIASVILGLSIILLVGFLRLLFFLFNPFIQVLVIWIILLKNTMVLQKVKNLLLDIGG